MENGGSRNILIDARKKQFSFTCPISEENKKEYYLSDFQKHFPCNNTAAAVEALLMPPQSELEKGQAMNSQGFFASSTDSDSDDENTCAPPCSPSTRPNTPV